MEGGPFGKNMNVDSKEFENKKILIIQQRGWGTRTGHYLATQLNKEGAELAAVVMKRSALKFTKEQTDVKYKLVTSYDEIVEDPKKFLGNDDYTLKEICDDLEIDSVWPYVLSLREHTRSYKDKYYYGYKQGMTDEEIIDYIKATYKHVKLVFDKFNPELILAPNIATLMHIFFDLYGKKRGVKMIRAIESGVRGVGILVNGYQADGGRFFDRLEALNKGEVSENFNRAQKYVEETSQKLIRPLYSDKDFQKKLLMKKIRELLAPFKKMVEYYFSGRVNRLENIKVTIDTRSPKYIFRDFFMHRRNERLTKKYNYDDLEKIDKYIYFALQFTPEETIDVFAPRFNNQLEVIRQLALSAPDDYKIVVKEHPTMVGLRSISYMEKISRTPNVKLVDYRISADKVIRGADLIVSLSGTTLAEAAFLKKPAIQLGDLGLTKVFPNVSTHTDLTTLSKKIKEKLDQKLDTSEYTKQLINHVAAVYDVSYDCDFVGLWRGLTTDKIENLWKMYKDEINYYLK